MVLEIIVAGLLGICGTLAGAFIAHYFAGKRERQKSRTGEWKRVIDEVFSPMVFDLMSIRKGLLLQLEALGKTLADPQEKYPKEQIIASISLIASLSTRFRRNSMLEEILRKNSRLIKPRSLWLDLFLFHSYLTDIEELFSMIGAGIFMKSFDKLMTVVKYCIYVGDRLEDAASHLTIHFSTITVSQAEMSSSIGYTPFFTETVREEIEEKNKSMTNILFPLRDQGYADSEEKA